MKRIAAVTAALAALGCSGQPHVAGTWLGVCTTDVNVVTLGPITLDAFDGNELAGEVGTFDIAIGIGPVEGVDAEGAPLFAAEQVARIVQCTDEVACTEAGITYLPGDIHLVAAQEQATMNETQTFNMVAPLGDDDEVTGECWGLYPGIGMAYGAGTLTKVD